MIQATSGKLYWNYFLALEHDLVGVSRYIEFCEPNFSVYSIELAHLLFAAASEVDVIAKALSQILDPNSPCRNINDCRAILTAKLPDLPTAQVAVPRYGLTLTPWDNWAGTTNPVWWRSYNNVKHERNLYFHEATLKNAVNALGALLILTYYYYSHALRPAGAQCLASKETTLQLEPQSTLLRLQGDYYYETVIT